MTNPLRDSVNARIGHDTGDYAELIVSKAWANALRAPRSHASHEACSGLRPSGFDRISHSTGEEPGAQQVPGTDK